MADFNLELVFANRGENSSPSTFDPVDRAMHCSHETKNSPCCFRGSRRLLSSLNLRRCVAFRAQRVEIFGHVGSGVVLLVSFGWRGDAVCVLLVGTLFARLAFAVATWWAGCGGGRLFQGL